ncbi:MAG TPA: PC4/YdbC family ssDNA-binding protein, partial [Caulobacteraceae bacterium]|nr:PC4/YdbC family ssDNA-binding protein [Caulobacteraceae bacterium]
PSDVDQLSGDRREDSAKAAAAQLPLAIGSVRKDNHDEIRVAIESFGGSTLVDIRVYSDLTTTARVRFATKRGVSIHVDRLRELIDLLGQAEISAANLGLIR